jgi:hypothetical protein
MPQTEPPPANHAQQCMFVLHDVERDDGTEEKNRR